MTLKERQRLSMDIQTRIHFLTAHKVPSSEVRLEVEHGILPLITRAMDKVVARTREEINIVELPDGKGVWLRNG